MIDKEVVECASKIKEFCVVHFDRDGCEDCPFFDNSTRTKCLIAPKNADPWEWRINRRADNG